MPFKLVLWDVGNVLNYADHALTHRRLVELGVSPARAQLFYTNRAYADFARGQISGLDFYYQLVAEVLRADLSLYQVIDAHDRHMVSADQLALSLVSRSTVPIAFATNTNTWQNRREQELVGELERFKPIWTFRSNEQGLLKTDPGGMALIADQLNRHARVHADEILFIDDSRTNREAAEQSGMVTYAYLPNTGAAECERYLLELDLIT